MNNKLNFLFFNYSFLSSILQDRLFLNISSLYYNNLKFYFLLKNESQNRFLFILKLMLIEKLTNNKVKFIYNANLLKKKKNESRWLFSNFKTKNIFFFIAYFLLFIT